MNPIRKEVQIGDCRLILGDYFDIACSRIGKAYSQPDFFVERPPEPKQEALL